MTSKRSEGILGLVLLGAIVLLSILLSFLPGGAPSDGEGSVSSVEPRGRRALYLLLRESGFDARAFVDAPRDLPRDHSLLWLPRAPTASMPRGNNGVTRGGDPDRVGLHRLDFYKTFVEAGGTIVLAAGEDTRAFLVDALGIAEAEELAIDADFDSEIEFVRTTNGEEWAFEGSSKVLRAFDPNSAVRTLWTLASPESKHPFAVEFPSGLGGVVVLASDAFVENRHIGEHEHALAAVRLVEELAHGRPILFSEYEAGRWDPPSTLSLLFSPTLLLASLHALALLGLFVWMQGFTRAFPRDPEPLALFSPYLRARSLSDVFRRARRLQSLSAMLQSGALARFRTVARVHARRVVLDESGGSALPRITREDVVSFAREAGLVDLEPELLQALEPKKTANVAQLDELDARLRDLEQEIERRTNGRAAAPKRAGES
ncbi:MAG: hypothetical protein SGI72_05655 [Planctomycetota bacterium]|nr:hypothetical protein [Planctomycetota bacterium]